MWSTRWRRRAPISLRLEPFKVRRAIELDFRTLRVRVCVCVCVDDTHARRRQL